MKESEINNKMITILLDMMKKYIHQFSVDDAKKNEAEMEMKGSWHFIPNSISIVLSKFILLQEFLKKEKRWSGHKSHEAKFLDVGCGVGNILVFAKRTLYHCDTFHGFEISDDVISKAKAFIYPHDKYDHRLHIYKQDIMLYDEYNKYDIIYYYCPFKNHLMEKKLERMIEDQMKVGAILIPYLKADGNIRKDKRFERINLGKEINSIYLKIKE